MAIAKFIQERIFDCLKTVSPEQFNNFLLDHNVHVPRDAQKLILMNVIDENIDSYYDELSDETKYKIQNGIQNYSVRQLENLISKGVQIDTFEYLKRLMAFIMNYHTVYDLTEKDFMGYCDASHDKEIIKVNYYELKDIIEHIFFDRENQFDGIDLKIVRDSLYDFSTTSELRKLAKEYSVIVPRRINKDQIKEHIINMMIKRGDDITEELEETLNKLSIMKLEQFAKQNDIKVSLELRKEEIIEFILEYRPVLLDNQHILEQFSKIETFLGRLYDDEASELIKRITHTTKSRKKKSILDDLVLEVFEVVDEKPKRSFFFAKKEEKPKEKKYIKKKNTENQRKKRQRKRKLIKIRRNKKKQAKKDAKQAEVANVKQDTVDKKNKEPKPKIKKEKKPIDLERRKKIRLYVSILIISIGFIIAIYIAYMYMTYGDWNTVFDKFKELFGF